MKALRSFLVILVEFFWNKTWARSGLKFLGSSKEDGHGSLALNTIALFPQGLSENGPL